LHNNKFSKHQGKGTRKKQAQLHRKQTSLENSTVQNKLSYARAVKRQVPVLKDQIQRNKTKRDNDLIENSVTAQSSCHRRTSQHDHSLEMFVKATKESSLEEQKKML